MAVGICNKNGVDFDDVFESGDAGFKFNVLTGSGNGVDIGRKYARVEDGESPGPQGVYGRNRGKTGSPLEDAGYVFAKKGSTRPKILNAMIEYHEYFNRNDTSMYGRVAGGVFKVTFTFQTNAPGTVHFFLLVQQDNQQYVNPFVSPPGGYRICSMAVPRNVGTNAYNDFVGNGGVWTMAWKNNTVRQRACYTYSSIDTENKTCTLYISAIGHNNSNHSGYNRNFPGFGIVAFVKDKNGVVIGGRHLEVETGNDPSTPRNVFEGQFSARGDSWAESTFVSQTNGEIPYFNWIREHASFVGDGEYRYYQHNTDDPSWRALVDWSEITVPDTSGSDDGGA